MPKNTTVLVCPFDGSGGRARRGWALFLAAILATTILSGCAGLIASNTPTAPAGGALAATPSSVDFGNVEVGTTSTQTVNFSNSGTSDVAVSQAALNGTGFTMSGQAFPLTVPAGQSTAVSVQFAPTTTNTVSGSVLLMSNAKNSPTQIGLSGTGVRHQLSASPASVSFGNVAVGSSGSQTITLTNTGTASLSVSQIAANGPGFGVSGLSLPFTLAPGQSSNFGVQFVPAAAGAASGSVSVSSNAHNSPTVVALNGTGAQGTLSANPASVNFSNIQVGSSASTQIALTNSGTANVTISQATASGTGFSVTGLSVPQTINAGAGVSFTAKFAPVSAGSNSGSISIASNAPGSPLTIALSGTGTQPQLVITPTNVNFGNVNVGGSVGQTISLANPGNAALTISQATVAGTGFSVTGLSVPQTINAGASVSFTAQFAPTTAGSATGSVSIASNAPGSPAGISLAGTGVQAQLTASPSSFNFGNVAVGGSGSQAITLTNSGTSSVAISQASASGTGFSISGLSVPATLSAGQSTSFTALFTPTASGSATGSVSITSNAPSSPLTIALSGTGTQPQLSITPGSVAFGNVVVGARNSQTITLKNTGNASLTISQASASGTGFSITGLTTPANLAAGASTTFTVAFVPGAAGAVTGGVSLTSNAPGSPQSISLSGTGVAATFLIGANPTSLGFGNVSVGGNSASSVTLSNTGNSNVTISGVTLSGAGFTASGITSGTVIAPNQSAILNVAFAPTAAGSVTGSASIASNATNSPTVIALSGTGVQQSAAFPVWVADSLLRVGQTDAPGTTSSIALSGARGETVDTQVVVQGPSSGLTSVNLSASALSGPNGASIPAADVILYREYYISVTGTASYGGGSNPPLGSGTYPEPLIPFNDPETGAALCATSASLKACNASVSAGHNQPYWIDISIPHGVANSPTGTYTGTISVTADQGTATIPVTLTVWNFELPMQPSELSLWTSWSPNSGNTVTTLAQALMRNKVMGWYDVAGNAASDITNFGLNRSGLDNYYYIGIQCGGSFSSLPSTSQINAAAANFPAGLGLDFFVADELNGCTGDYSPIKTLSANAHAANRSVKIIMTLNTPDPNLYGYVDHWVLLDSVQQWPALPFSNGDLWSYTSCNTGFGNTPEWLVDYPPINERIQVGYLNWTQGATGSLYYRADGWTSGNAIGSWNNVDTTACGGGLGRPGDGIFIYPPAPIGSTESAPGIRLKAIRDGIQDYEYAHMLNSLGQLSFLNSVIAPIATSWTNWTHNPAALESARTQLGQQLHTLAP